mgnify:FL=1
MAQAQCNFISDPNPAGECKPSILKLILLGLAGGSLGIFIIFLVFVIAGGASVLPELNEFFLFMMFYGSEIAMGVIAIIVILLLFAMRK